MDPILRRIKFESVLAMIVASLMLLGVGIAAGPAHAGMSVVCAPAQNAPDQSGPAFPEAVGDHGLCCVAACGLAGKLPSRPRISGGDPIEEPAMLAVPAAVAPALRLEPQRAPQSPRAPPVTFPYFSREA